MSTIFCGVTMPRASIMRRPRLGLMARLQPAQTTAGNGSWLRGPLSGRNPHSTPKAIFPLSPALGQRWGQLTRPNNKGKQMTIKALVMSDRPDEYTGKKGLVKQQIITVMDLSETGERLAQPIEYALNDEEKPVHSGKLQDKVINLGIRELLPFGGRLRARGKIVGLFGK